MAYLIDSCVLLDVLTDDSQWADISQSLLDQYSEEDLLINPIIYTEISIGYAKSSDLEKVMEIMSLTWEELPREALFLTGKIFLSYRKNRGNKIRPMPDFYIGAHAQVAHHTIITRDIARYHTYFPDVKLVTP